VAAPWSDEFRARSLTSSRISARSSPDAGTLRPVAELERMLACTGALVGALLLVMQLPGEAATLRVVRLRNAFIEAVKNRATITNLSFTFDHVKTSINSIASGGDDGDLHMAGRPGPFVGLPMVAEVVNARLERDDVVKRAKELGTSQTAKISGFWRLWFEHPPSTVLVQGGTVPKPTTTNPDHIFEIHPITEVDGHEADESFVPIEGYSAYTAKQGVRGVREARVPRETEQYVHNGLWRNGRLQLHRIRSGTGGQSAPRKRRHVRARRCARDNWSVCRGGATAHRGRGRDEGSRCVCSEAPCEGHAYPRARDSAGQS